MNKQEIYRSIAAQARPGKRPTDLLRNSRPKLFTKLTERYGKLSSEILYRHLQPDAPTECIQCSKPSVFINFLLGYQPYCSRDCCHTSGNQHSQNIQKTILKNHGVTVPAKSSRVQKKMRRTLLKRYGVDNASKSEKVKAKKRSTSRKNYGVPYPNQSREVFEKTWAALRARKDVVVGGRKFRVQGFEPQALEYLVERVGVKASSFKKPEAVPYVTMRMGASGTTTLILL